jgi:hypothetical protein
MSSFMLLSASNMSSSMETKASKGNRLPRSIAETLRPASAKNARAATATTPPAGGPAFEAGVTVRLVTPLTSGCTRLRKMPLVHADGTEASEEGDQTSRPEEKHCKSPPSAMEPAGIEPATSCLQRERGRVSRKRD